MKNPAAAWTALAVLALTACAQSTDAPSASSPAPAVTSAAPTPAPTPSPTPSASPTPTPSPTPTVDTKGMIRRAEAAVEAELPGTPLWEGTTFKGAVLDESTVCVDRFWGPGGGIDGDEGDSAGYVIVTFPDETVGEPQEGECPDEPEPEETTPSVEVPDSLADDPGIVTRTDLGEEWPLTVDYGVLGCEDVSGGQNATFTDSDGTEYALNGTAKANTDGEDIDAIWADDPDIEGLKIDIGPLIDKALDLC